MNYYNAKQKSSNIIVKIMIILLLLAALGGALVIYNKNQARKAQANVGVTVTYSKTLCNNSAYPLLVTINNKTTKTINHVDFYLGVYFPGNSNNLAHSDKYVSYKIIGPHQTAQTCYQLPQLDLSTLSKVSIPTDNSAYEYTIMRKTAVFK